MTIRKLHVSFLTCQSHDHLAAAPAVNNTNSRDTLTVPMVLANKGGRVKLGSKNTEQNTRGC